MKEQFYDLNIETLDDGTIRLEQRDYCGESAIIDLHPVQAAHIADGLPVAAPYVRQMSALEADRIGTLERRLLWMCDRFDECHAVLPSDFYERCGDSLEFAAWLDASITVAGEFCADFPNASSISPSNTQASPLAASSSLPGDGCLPSVAGCAGEHPEQPSGDLFSDTTGGKQDGN